MIDGVLITPLKQIFDERGKVMHMLRNDSPVFSNFGEIYFSCTYPEAIKAWHMHTTMILNYAVIDGAIKCVLFDQFFYIEMAQRIPFEKELISYSVSCEMCIQLLSISLYTMLPILRNCAYSVAYSSILNYSEEN